MEMHTRASCTVDHECIATTRDHDSLTRDAATTSKSSEVIDVCHAELH
jgi:hypothetical protein